MSRRTNLSGWNRRQFMTAMGLTTGSLFLPSIARAQDGPPLRFLLFYTSQGAVPNRWLCNPYGHSEDRTWDDDWTSSSTTRASSERTGTTRGI